MIGVVGNIKVCYIISGNQHEEIVDPKITSEFCLKYCSSIKFRIEEVTYIEDTVYGVVLSLIEPHIKEDEYIVDGGTTNFKIEEYCVIGRFSLCYQGGNR